MKLKLAASLLFAAVSASAFAAPIDMQNVRPVPTLGTSSEPTLQSILDSFAGAGAIDVANDQSANVYWASAINPPTTVPTLAVEYTANADVQVFGMWFGTDTANTVLVPLFNGAAIGNPNPLDGINRSKATVAFAPGMIEVTGSGTASTCGTQIYCGTTANPLISSSMFGFYFQVGSLTVYSSDLLSSTAGNAGSRPRFLAYESQLAPTNWFFAYEDGTDFDYNDMVVKVESITRVPLPGTLALLGLGLVGAAALRRKQQA